MTFCFKLEMNKSILLCSRCLNFIKLPITIQIESKGRTSTKLVKIFIKNTIVFSLNDMFREVFSHFQVKKYLQKNLLYISKVEKIISYLHLYKRMCNEVTMAC